MTEIKQGFKVTFELDPYGGPRWRPDPYGRTFIDKGYTDKYGTGYVKAYENGIIHIRFDEAYRILFHSGISMVDSEYEANKHLHGFYKIEEPKIACDCGVGDAGPHWNFCSTWKK